MTEFAQTVLKSLQSNKKFKEKVKNTFSFFEDCDTIYNRIILIGEILTMLVWLITAGAIVALDQIAKILVTAFLDKTDSICVIPYLFDFVYVENTGAAFSILSGRTGFLGIISVLFCIGVPVYWLKVKPKHKLMKTSLTLLFAGALGNAIDRIFRGFVVDFISASFMEFPVFNVADISIVFGAILLVVYVMFYEKEEKDGKVEGEQPGEVEA